MLGNLRSRTLDDFKEAFDKALDRGGGFVVAVSECTQSFMSAFDEGCADIAIYQANWDSSKVREKLRRDIDAHVAFVRATKLFGLVAHYEKQLNIVALSEPVEALLDSAIDDTWLIIKSLLQRETTSASSGLSSALYGFDIDKETVDKMLASISDYARNVVETKAKEESGRVLIRMKDK